MLLLLEEEADRTTTEFRKAKSRDRREAENNEKWGCNPPPIFGKNGISGHVACCMVVNRVLSHSSHFPSRTYLFPIIILSIRTVSAGILDSVWSQHSQHTCTNVISPSPGILQLFRFHLSECLVACWEIDGAVRVFHSKSICCKSNPIERATAKQHECWFENQVTATLYFCCSHSGHQDWVELLLVGSSHHDH